MYTQATTTLTNLWTGTNPKGTKVSHLQYWSNLINQFEIQYPDTDKCNLINWTKNFNINIPQDHKTDSFKNSLIQSQYTVYTDGSKTKTGTGAGYVIYLKQEKNQRRQLSPPNKCYHFSS